ncbi:protein phosphatase 2C domain-containing protein [uncultured Thiodictyon sp.]|uniref:PP2C family protein-serine/threonine phosphatase n=1 Tax=uncultured Thiodictyon sp. TaxID=1846217 RepID=UPI0025D55AE2|nr:protein phosphatase 2C domain-containing protein [uncultured Thiodictyon sp.]
MQLRPGSAQWIGGRADQQDACGFEQDAAGGCRGVLAIVADGIGGLSDGAAASRLAVQQMLAAYAGRRPDEPIPQALRHALSAANRAVYDAACRGAGEYSMGTTLVAAAVKGDLLYWVSVGDSRLYLYRGADRSITQCTRDHNYRNELLEKVAEGRLSRAAAEAEPGGDALTSFVGMPEITRIDCNHSPVTLIPGDRVLLCSDGIHGVLTPDEMAAALGQEAQAGADAVMAAVKAKGLERQDNSTVAVIACGGASAPSESEHPQASPVGRRWRRRLAMLLGFLAALGGGVWIARDLGTWLPGSGLGDGRPPRPSALPAEIPSTAPLGTGALPAGH